MLFVRYLGQFLIGLIFCGVVSIRSLSYDAFVYTTLTPKSENSHGL